MPAEPPVLEIRDLRVEIRTDDGVLRPVKGANLSVRRGRTLGLVGESGCGKSITMRAAMRILPLGATIEAGAQIILRDERGAALDLAALPANGARMRAVRGGRVAMIFQEPTASLSPVHTVGAHLAEVIGLHRGLRGAAARAIALDLLDQVGIPNPPLRIKQYPHELSGGMRQRVMIALALAGKPEVLIADEPTTALDVTIQAQILELLRELQQTEQMAMIFISHDMGVVARVADEIAVMYLGEVVERGPAAAVVAAPRHPYADGLLRAMPNLSADGARLSPIPGDIPGPLEVISGCPFHPRCGKRLAARCDSEVPPAFDADGRIVKCFLAEGTAR